MDTSANYLEIDQERERKRERKSIPFKFDKKMENSFVEEFGCST